MPTTVNDSIVLDYEVSGEGPPVLLISGLSAQRPFWGLARPLLTGFTLVEFDNRDIGRSGQASGPYTVADMARDALAVLDAAGVGRAHVVGHSMGGAIAQELAIAAPGRVDRLVLANTYARQNLYTREIMRLFADLRARLDDELVFGAALTSFVLGEHTLKHQALYGIVQASLDAGLDQPKAGFLRQLDACAKADTLDRLHAITAPTLVLYSDDDRLFSPAMAREIASGIPAGSDLDEIVDSGHCPMVEQPAAFAEVVRRFLGAAGR
ncbi:alpha/beta hydrolase [Xanthobacter sp. V4C-4]|uniref:alpha/beta fold hydrolase n=1 Tax=Xanthobacter cornucopiae TaxID=3119924 RepID=UPI003726A62F